MWHSPGMVWSTVLRGGDAGCNLVALNSSGETLSSMSHGDNSGIDLVVRSKGGLGIGKAGAARDPRTRSEFERFEIDGLSTSKPGNCSATSSIVCVVWPT